MVEVVGVILVILVVLVVAVVGGTRVVRVVRANGITKMSSKKDETRISDKDTVLIREGCVPQIK